MKDSCPVELQATSFKLQEKSRPSTHLQCPAREARCLQLIQKQQYQPPAWLDQRFSAIYRPARRPEDGRCTATLIKSRAFADL
jgi:hypothetical protein